MTTIDCHLGQVAQFRHRSTIYGTQNVLCVELAKKKKKKMWAIDIPEKKAFVGKSEGEIAWNIKKSNATVEFMKNT